MKKNFVFTSAGDNTNFHTLWSGDNQTYDIYVIYYGNNDDNYNLYKSKVKYIEKRSGSKFQNFLYFYKKNPDIINQYKYFFILDDDIIFNVNCINKMFFIANKYKLSICGPSFDHKSKISHSITKHRSKRFLTYTNFVEVNVPLFNKPALDKLMKVLSPALIGWGIDFLYILVNGRHKSRAYAIIHDIKCINPHPLKSKPRELTLIKNCNKRSQIWRNYAKRHKLPAAFIKKEYKTIYKTKN